jgi:hypothetical protein
VPGRPSKPARAWGRTGGRKPKLTDRQVATVRRMYEALGADGKRQHTVAEIAEAVSVHRTTIYEYLKAGKGISAADDQAGASGAAASLRPPSRGLPAEFRRQPLPHPAQGGRRIRPEFPAIRGDPICRPSGAGQDSVPDVRMVEREQTAQIRGLQVRPVKVAPGHAGAPQVRTSELRSLQVRVVEDRAAEGWRCASPVSASAWF